MNDTRYQDKSRRSSDLSRTHTFKTVSVLASFAGTVCIMSFPVSAVRAVSLTALALGATALYLYGSRAKKTEVSDPLPTESRFRNESESSTESSISSIVSSPSVSVSTLLTLAQRLYDVLAESTRRQTGKRKKNIGSMEKQWIDSCRTKLSNGLVTQVKEACLAPVVLSLYAAVVFVETRVDTVGQWRDDLGLCWKALGTLLKRIGSLEKDDQYVLIIFACWTAQRMQSGKALLEILTQTLPLVEAGKLYCHCYPQLICIAAIVNAWEDAAMLANLLYKEDKEVYEDRCHNYHGFCASDLRLYLDLKQAIDFSRERKSASLLENAKSFEDSDFSKYLWQMCYMRSLRFKNDAGEWEETRKSHINGSVLYRTGLYGRMQSCFHDDRFVLTGPVSESEITLVGYDDGIVEDESDSVEKIPDLAHRVLVKEILKLKPRVVSGDALSYKNFWQGTWTFKKVAAKRAHTDAESSDNLVKSVFSESKVEVVEDVAAEVVSTSKTFIPLSKDDKAVVELVEHGLNTLRDEITEEGQTILEENSLEVEVEFCPFMNFLETPRDFFMFYTDFARFLSLLKS